MDNVVLIVDVVFSWIRDVALTLVSFAAKQPIIFLSVGIFVVGAVIGLVYRLTRG